MVEQTKLKLINKNVLSFLLKGSKVCALLMSTGKSRCSYKERASTVCLCLMIRFYQ